MAHFRGTVRGNRGLASRLGTKKSGLYVSVNGWNIGVAVSMAHINGKDSVSIVLTGGSNSCGRVKELGRFVEGESIN